LPRGKRRIFGIANPSKIHEKSLESQKSNENPRNPKNPTKISKIP
jgi:hypothetical protein